MELYFGCRRQTSIVSLESRPVGLVEVGVRVAPLLAVARGEPLDRLSLHESCLIVN